MGNEARNAERGAGSEEGSDLRPPTSDLAPFEATLSSLAPRAARLDRDRLMFSAGQAALQASGGRQPPDVTANLPVSRWGWPAAFSAMTALAASLLVMLVNRPEPQVIERIVRVPAAASRAIASPPAGLDRQAIESQPPVSTAPGRPAFGAAYLHARDQALAFGLDSWMQSGPGLASGAAPQANYLQLRESLLQ